MLACNKILITGASGFIGKHLLEKLILEDYQIACLGKKFDDKFISLYKDRVQFFIGNILDKNFINLCIDKFSPNYIYHLAGSKSRTNAADEFRTSNEINYTGTLNLFESLIGKKYIKLITIIGTIEEYGRTPSPFKESSYELPTSAYGLSKLSTTKLGLIFSEQFNLPVLVVRPSIAYGPEQGEEMFIPALIKTLLKTEPFKMTAGMQLRDFIFIDDLIEALVKVVKIEGLAGNVINVASGYSVKLKDVAEQIANIIGNINSLKIGAIPYRKAEIMDYEVSIDKANNLLKWHPKTSLENGLIKTINFYKKNLFYEI